MKCSRKPASTTVVFRKIFCIDVTTMRSTASLCQILGGLRNRLFSMASFQWKTTIATREECTRIEKLGSLVEYRRWSRTTVMNMWKRLHKERQRFILYSGQVSEETNNAKDLKKWSGRSSNRKMLASPLYIREREANEGQTRGFLSVRESFVTGFFSGSRSFVETWCSVFMPKWIYSKHWRNGCCFTRLGRMQSSSTTHYQLFAWRKWNAWRRRMSKRKGTLDSESTAGCSKRTRKTVNKMFANDGSSTSPAQEGSHTLTDCLESAGQELHFSRICARIPMLLSRKVLAGMGRASWSLSATASLLPMFHPVKSSQVQLAADVRHCLAKPCRKTEGKEGWTRSKFWRLGRSVEVKDRGVQKYLENLPKNILLVQVWSSLRRKGLQFYQTRSHAIALFKIIHAICFEKVVNMEIGKDFYSKVFQFPRLPRSVLMPYLEHGRQDPSSLEARKSADHQSEQSSKYEQTHHSHLQEAPQAFSNKITWRSTRKLFAVTLITEFKIHFTQQFRKQMVIAIVKRLIQQFENHPNRDSFVEDLNKTEECNPFSEESKELITSLGNTEHFELCEISSKIHCFDCALD